MENFVRLTSMDIQYFGYSCFRIKGKEIVLTTDPFSPSPGIKLPKISSDIITVSHDHQDHNFVEHITEAITRPQPFVINGPGEYEISGVSITGIPSFHDSVSGKNFGCNTIYIVTMDGIRLVHLGDIGQQLTDQQIEEINGVDILFVPVGGTYTLDSKQAQEVVGKVEPSITIPMHYKLPGVSFDLATVEDFLSQMGIEEVEKVDKLNINREKLPEEKKVVVLNARC